MLNLIPMTFALAMASIDAIVLGGLKEYSLGNLNWSLMVPIGMLIYSLQPLLFLQSLKYETMTIMNILWDITSDVIVSIVGLFYFKEGLTPLKKLGLSLAFIAIVLLSYDSINGSSK
jgi:multidrug transporter EmrE-like cation transporter